MLDKNITLIAFQEKVMCALADFKCLALEDRFLAIDFLEKCTKDLHKNIEIPKLSKAKYICDNNLNKKSVEENEKEIIKKKSILTNIISSDTNNLLTTCDVENQLNILYTNDFSLPESSTDDSSDSEIDGSTRTELLQKHLNSIVEKLENDETFLHSDNVLLETNYANNNNKSVTDTDVNIQHSNVGDINTNGNFITTLNCENNSKVSPSKVNNFNLSRDVLASSQSDTDMNDYSEPNEPTTKKFTCLICREQLKSYILLMVHLFEHPGTSQSCLPCKKTFGNAISYNYHLANGYCDPEIKLNPYTIKEVPMMKCLCCPYCGKKYKKTFNLKRHVSVCDFAISSSSNVPFFDDTTGNLSSNQSIMRRKSNMIASKIKCPKCDLSFGSRQSLRRHSITHKKINQNKYFCEACDISFPIRALYREHMKKNKDDAKHLELKKSMETKRVWCNTCVVSFVDEKSYKRHCSSENHLKASRQPMLNSKSFVCEKCGLSFKRKECLVGHYYKMHKERDILVCNECTYTSVNPNNMNRHKKNYHGYGERLFACDKCPALFDQLSGLKEHEKGLHSDERPFNCDICNKQFKLKNQLNKHKVIHNTVMRFHCSHCDMKFQRNSHLQRHIQSKHDDTINKINSTVGKFPMKTVKEDLNPENRIHPEPSIPQDMNGLDNNEVYSMIDVQSGELMLLSVTDMSKNIVLNIAPDGDLLNSVHIPDLWNGPDPNLYANEPMMQTNAVDTPYILQSNTVPSSVPKVLNSYVPNYLEIPDKNMGDIEMLAGDLLTQNALTSEIVSDHTFENLNHLSLPQVYDVIKLE